MPSPIRLCWTLLALLAVAPPGRAAPLPEIYPVFTNVTKPAGIDFTYTFGDRELSSILESTGGGCAFLDYDRDGYLDLYLVSGVPLPGISHPDTAAPVVQASSLNRLYHNSRDGTFADVTRKAGVGGVGYGVGVVAADYDNDGWTDLFLANYGPNTLYRNNRDGTFTDVTSRAGLAGPDSLNGFRKWSVHAAFLDYDRDGHLDLYVGNYLAFDPAYRLYFAPDAFPGPLDYRGQPDTLYRNNGDGTFSDVTRAAGVHNPEGRAMSVTAGDFDGDGWTDLFVANDAMENYLYRNNGDGAFTSEALRRGVAFGAFGEATSGMGPNFGDFDNDGRPDLFVPNMTYGCLYRNNGSAFDEVTAAAGIAQVCGQFTGWGGLVFDCENDGLPDIFITNGDAHHLYPQESLLLGNRGDWTFEDHSLKSGDYFIRKEYVGRGAAAGDYDNDGDIDILASNLNGPAVLLRNEGSTGPAGDGAGNHWLTIKLEGGMRTTKPDPVHSSGLMPQASRLSNRDGIGARVVITAGASKQTAEVRAGSGYLSCSDPRIHFGLGRHARVDFLEIRWPGGAIQTLRDILADQILTVREPVR